MVVRVVWSPVEGWSAAARRAHARDLIRAQVADLVTLDPLDISVSAVCPRCGGAHGQPVVRLNRGGATPWVSISRSSPVVVVAVSTDGPVGVDAESPSAAGLDVAGVVLHPGESAADAAALTTTWVRKEALLKLTGHGLSVNPSNVVVSDPSAPPRLVGWDLPDEPPAPVWMQDLQLGSFAVGCVAVQSERRPGVSVRHAPARAAASPHAARP